MPARFTKEDRFIYEFNLLFTFGDYWDRTPGNVKPREKELRKLYKKFIKKVYKKRKK